MYRGSELTEKRRSIKIECKSQQNGLRCGAEMPRVMASLMKLDEMDVSFRHTAFLSSIRFLKATHSSAGCVWQFREPKGVYRLYVLWNYHLVGIGMVLNQWKGKTQFSQNRGLVNICSAA